MKKMYFVAVALLLPLLAGCGATGRSNLNAPNIQLRQYKNIQLMLQSSSGAISVSGVNVSNAFGGATATPNSVQASAVAGSMTSSHAMDGSNQSLLVAQDLSFELGALGFNLVDDSSKADAIALFSIGTVRYDPLAGWIADQAFLTFKDAKSQDTLAAFKATVVFVTPTTKMLLNTLVNKVRDSY